MASVNPSVNHIVSKIVAFATKPTGPHAGVTPQARQSLVHDAAVGEPGTFHKLASELGMKPTELMVSDVRDASRIILAVPAVALGGAAAVETTAQL